jgi:2-beta-glucuronyltransferase
MLRRSAPVPRLVIVSAVHDYRMARRGSIQAAADAFARAGYETTFLSIRFSPISIVKNDPRAFLDSRSNQFERSGDIKCYLWKTPWHPFATRSSTCNRLTAPLHEVYARWANDDVDGLFRRADVVIVESGLGVIFLERVRRLNEKALLIYRAADALDTIGAHPHLQERLEQSAAVVDHYCLLARGMAQQFSFAQSKAFFVPQGVHGPDFDLASPNPYPADGRSVAVSVGSMLFEPTYFEVAAPAFPDVQFHVIGCRAALKSSANLHVHREMRFAAMAPYMTHASIGIAPYRTAPMAHYLAESSLKLTQFRYLRKPAVCPSFAVGEYAHRWGYTPGDADEIIAATRAALLDRFSADEPAPLTWEDVAPRLLRPTDYPDTAIAPRYFEIQAKDGATRDGRRTRAGASRRFVRHKPA